MMMVKQTKIEKRSNFTDTNWMVWEFLETELAKKTYCRYNCDGLEMTGSIIIKYHLHTSEALFPPSKLRVTNYVSKILKMTYSRTLFSKNYIWTFSLYGMYFIHPTPSLVGLLLFSLIFMIINFKWDWNKLERFISYLSNSQWYLYFKISTGRIWGYWILNLTMT